jgi:hypothetical protein
MNGWLIESCFGVCTGFNVRVGRLLVLCPSLLDCILHRIPLLESCICIHIRRFVITIIGKEVFGFKIGHKVCLPFAA